MNLDETNPLESEQETIIDQAPETEIKTDEGPVSLDDDEPEILEANDEPEGESEPTEEEGIEAAAQFAEVELNGEIYQVPSELKDGYLMQADYTRKTQENAQIRRETEALREQAQQAVQVSQDELQVRADLLNTNRELSRFENVDWREYMNQDPVGAQQDRWDFENLLKAQQEQQGFVDNVSNQRSEQAKHETAQRLQETFDYAKTNIKGWTPEIGEKLKGFAMGELGYSIEQLEAETTPQRYQEVYLAYLGSQSLKQAQNRQPRPAATVRPLKTVSAKSSGQSTKDPADMSMAEYDAWASKRYK